jgi:hypothetical protein
VTLEGLLAREVLLPSGVALGVGTIVCLLRSAWRSARVKSGRRRRMRDASRFERFLAYYGLKGLTAARENRPPVDLAIARRKRMWATVMVLVPGVCGVLFAVQVEVTLAGIVCFVWLAMALAWTARYELKSSERRESSKRGRGPSGLLPREAPMTDELPAEHRAKAAREDRE